MAEAAHDRERGRSLGNQSAGVRVAEVVKSGVGRDPRPPDRRSEVPVVEVSVSERSACGGVEDQVIGLLPDDKRGEVFDEETGHGHGATLVVLGWPERESACAFCGGFCDLDAAA